jgi:hypothetical protein
MKEAQSEKDKSTGGVIGASGLMERLLWVRKRKRAFEGPSVHMEAVRRQVEAERRQKRER